MDLSNDGQWERYFLLIQINYSHHQPSNDWIGDFPDDTINQNQYNQSMQLARGSFYTTR